MPQPLHSPPDNDYSQLVAQLSTIYRKGQVAAYRAIDQQMVQTYWELGRHIVEFEQKGATKAKYGEGLLSRITRDLTLEHGKGFSLSNVKRFRQFYLLYPIGATASHQLGWSHIVELLKIDDPLERAFYQKQAEREKWSVRELIRQKKTSLYLRLAAAKDKEGILQLAQQGQVVEKPTDLLRDVYVFEFLKIPEPYRFSESELEERLLSHLQHFLLELGKGFAFIGRQYRITLGNRHHYVDLVFYHRILKCFVLIDLKREEAGYEDVGQMNMYLGYFENEEATEGDNPPIGIVLARSKDDLVIKYAMQNISSQLFVQKYQLYLPNQEELRQLIEEELSKEEGDNL
jgi:predicted nuclease of restriction endonuclease-like (RecB) superfamily